MSFNLTALIRAAREEIGEPDVSLIAKHVLPQIPEDERDRLLEAALRHHARMYLSSERRGIFEGEDENEFEGTVIESSPVKGARKPHLGTSVKTVREAWKARLDYAYHTEGGYKKLRDMTYADFMFAVDERKTIAQTNLAEAKVLESRAKLLEKHGVAVFGELPENVQKTELSK
jgi:hypothetical protein